MKTLLITCAKIILMKMHYFLQNIRMTTIKLWLREKSIWPQINRKLKDICSTGHISFHKCCRTLHKFKSDYRKYYDFKITGNNPQNRRSALTKTRHEEILKIFDQWSSFNFDCKSSFCVIYFMKFEKITVVWIELPKLQNMSLT